MSAHEADHIQALLTRLMDGVHDNANLHAEVARAQREFFQANPQAPQNDPASRFRFQEWYLIERESEVMGAVPITCLAMSDAERESLMDSLVGVFRVTNVTAAEYTIEDLEDQQIHDLSRIDGADLEPGDVLVGRLFEGSLDVFIGSPVMSCQRDAGPLAMAFQKDVAALDLGRRLTQAEIEHLLFRGRGAEVAETLADDLPLERIEAELETSLELGGAIDHSATAISAALRDAVRPGVVSNPLLTTLAFDTDVDIDVVQRLLMQIWNCHQRHGRSAPPPESAETRATESRTSSQPGSDRGGDAAGDDRSNLGGEVARRIEEGLTDDADVAEVFADIERMVGVEPDPSYEPGTVDLSADMATGEDDDDAPTEGDLRPLITEYLWETKRQGHDVTVLEQLVTTQCESSVPRLDLALVTSGDLFRILLQTYLESAPGDRTVAVGTSFSVIERFYAWTEKTQMYELAEVLDAVRETFVDHVARLESAGLALSGPLRTATGDTARSVIRVIQVTESGIEVDPDESDNLVRVVTAAAIRDNLCVDDILLGTLAVDADRRGSFAGMVVALPPAAAGLIG